MRIHALLLLLAQHIGSYMELGAAAATEYRSAWVRRAVLVTTGLAVGIVGLVALWGAGLVAVWDSSWRVAYAGGSAVVLLAIAGAVLYSGLAARMSGPSSGVLKSELRKDVELFQEWKSTL
ncbi:MAG: hypothetical protein ABW278_00395 [Steroidobacteraceae bacterium]